MQVTHVTDHVTHAVISSAQAIDFGISDSAEFFNILSSTLYSNQILAVVRETLCNGWDAHIEAGITDKPLHISMIRIKNEDHTETMHLIIRDFGTGIAKNMMGPIYGTYGGSTKKNDGKQTGGFGLGCKAPFAYGDHFEVTSWHGGQKTIYNLSKSNAEVGGKPSIMPIVSVPCGEETGLQVKLQIKNYEDFSKFKDLIKRIVANGEMNAKLFMGTNEDGIQLPTIPFSKAKLGFLLTREPVYPEHVGRIFLRYGNVIYPIEDHEDYTKLYGQIKSFIGHLPSSHYDNTRWRIVFQAAPHSISVTPSRESLSMQKHTVEAIKGLLEIFVKKERGELYKESIAVLEDMNKIGFNQVGNNPGEILTNLDNLPNHRIIKNQSEVNQLSTITTFDQMVKQYVLYEYPKFDGFKKRDLRMRLKTLLDNGFGGPNARGLIQSFRDEMEKVWSYPRHHSTWLQQRVLGPAATAVKNDPEMDIKKLFVYDRVRSQHKYYYDENKTKYHPILSYDSKNKSHLDNIAFIRNLVILSFNRMDVEDRASSTVMMKHWFGDPDQSLLYIVPRSTKKVTEARKFWTDRGYNVLDLTKLHHNEHESAIEPVKMPDRKPRKKGIPSLKSIAVMNDDGSIGHIDTSLARADDCDRISDPVFMIKIADRHASSSLPEVSGVDSKFIIKTFGDKGGIIVNKNQEEKYTALGVKPFEQFILEQFQEHIKNSPTFFKGLSFKISRVDSIANWSRHQHWRGILEMIQSDQTLAQYFGIEEVSTELDNQWYSVWQAFEHKARYAKDGWMHDLFKLMHKQKPNQVLLDLLESFIANKVNNRLNIINVDQIGYFLKSPNSDAMMKDRIRDLVVDLIEG